MTGTRRCTVIGCSRGCSACSRPARGERDQGRPGDPSHGQKPEGRDRLSRPPTANRSTAVRLGVAAQARRRAQGLGRSRRQGVGQEPAAARGCDRRAVAGFFPKQTYPIRTGVHPNTAFGLSFAHDYARAVDDKHLLALVGNATERTSARMSTSPRRGSRAGPISSRRA